MRSLARRSLAAGAVSSPSIVGATVKVVKRVACRARELRFIASTSRAYASSAEADAAVTAFRHHRFISTTSAVRPSSSAFSAPAFPRSEARQRDACRNIAKSSRALRRGECAVVGQPAGGEQSAPTCPAEHLCTLLAGQAYGAASIAAPAGIQAEADPRRPPPQSVLTNCTSTMHNICPSRD